MQQKGRSERKMRDPTKTTKETKDENRQTKSRVQNMSIWQKNRRNKKELKSEMRDLTPPMDVM